jgi:hypothetical protein
MDPPGDLMNFQVPTFSGWHRTSHGPKQGNTIVGPDPSVSKEDPLYAIQVLSESQVRDRLTPAGLGTAVHKWLVDQLADMVEKLEENLTNDRESELTGIADIIGTHQSEN